MKKIIILFVFIVLSNVVFSQDDDTKLDVINSEGNKTGEMDISDSYYSSDEFIDNFTRLTGSESCIVQGCCIICYDENNKRTCYKKSGCTECNECKKSGTIFHNSQTKIKPDGDKPGNQ